MIFERAWSMPNKQTFLIRPIQALLQEEIIGGVVVEPFAYMGTLKSVMMNHNSVKIIDNDLNPKYERDYCMDALDFLKMFDTSSVDIVVYDPPYSPRQVSECYGGIGRTVTQSTTQTSFWSNAKNEIARILRPGGKAICFGWNSGGIGMNRGFEMTRVLLVPHGSAKNDTIGTVEIKVKNVETTDCAEDNQTKLYA